LQLSEIAHQFITGIENTSLAEYIAVFAGILSVWYSRSENVMVYPIGLINTIVYIYISLKGELLGEVSVNFYYTIMSIYGWYLWTKKDKSKHPVLHISVATKREWLTHLSFFSFFYITIFFALQYLKKDFAPKAIPWADAIACSAAFTGMWLMTRKKLESWYWWIITNTASIPLYFVKGYVFTSMYYIILLAMSILGLNEWIKRKKLKIFKNG